VRRDWIFLLVALAGLSWIVRVAPRSQGRGLWALVVLAPAAVVLVLAERTRWLSGDGPSTCTCSSIGRRGSTRTGSGGVASA